MIGDTASRHAIARVVGMPAPARVPPAPPMPRKLPVASPVYPVAHLCVAEDRFRCERFRCTLSAGACVDRQKLAVPWARRRRKLTRYELSEAASISRYSVCRNCPQGLKAAAALGAGVPTEDREEAPGAAPTRGTRWRALAQGRPA